MANMPLNTAVEKQIDIPVGPNKGTEPNHAQRNVPTTHTPTHHALEVTRTHTFS